MSERNDNLGSSKAWFRPLWLGLLVAASAALTTMYTCVTPFAAFAVIAAMSLPRGQGLSFMTAVWLANQAVGFAMLSYPWTASTFAWGAAIGGAAMSGTLAAQWSVAWLGSLRATARTAFGFAAAFAVYELALYVVGVSMLGGLGAFAPRIIGQALLLNAGTLVVLLALKQLLAAVASTSRRLRVQASRARVA